MNQSSGTVTGSLSSNCNHSRRVDQPISVNSLINSVRSFINADTNQLKTFEFVAEVRRRLYSIYEHNCQFKHKFSQSKAFDSLLIKYVELEFDALYQNNSNPPKRQEFITELRVLRLLQVMYKSVLEESSISENTNAILKRAVLRLLSQVKPTCLVENKLVHNIVKKINGTSNIFNGCWSENGFWKDLWNESIHKNPATSDYGTDSDSDDDICHGDGFQITKLVTTKKSSDSDCVEVLATENGVSPLLTIELLEDDDCMVYLQSKQKETSERINNCDNLSVDSVKEKTCENSIDVEFTSPNLNLDRKNCDISKSNCPNSKSLSKTRSNSETDCVIICSDSEEDISNNKTSEHKLKNCSTTGVVTFEILDDGDDNLDYIVYLHKEVTTNKKSKRGELPCNVDTREVIMCSDSEEESVHESTINCKTEKVTVAETNVDEEKLALQEICKNLESEVIIDDTDIKSDESINFLSDESLNDNFKFNNAEFSQQSNEINHDYVITSIQENNQLLDTSLGENVNNLTIFENGWNICENFNSNFLVDPALILEQTCPQSLKNHLFEESLDKNHGNDYIQSRDESNAIGGPVLSEKVDTEDFDNLQDCRINDVLLEELMLDDNYLLEDRKEFEDLECFLFNSNREEEGIYNLRQFSIDNEAILQTEMLHENAEDLKTILNDTQSLMETNHIDNSNENKHQCSGAKGKRRGKEKFLLKRESARSNNCTYKASKKFVNRFCKKKLRTFEENLKLISTSRLDKISHSDR